MASPRVLVLRSPGANCDEETAEAFRLAGGVAQPVHVNRLLESPDLLADYQVLCVPGGFSYGDDIAAGRVLGGQLRRRLADACQRFRDDGKLVLGICNGYQVLMSAGLLDLDSEGAEGSGERSATLAWSDRGRYDARWVTLHATPGECVFLRGIDTIEMPVAHAEGRFAIRDSAALDRLRNAGQLVLRYAEGDNPNGSADDVAGVCDRSGRVLGLMPHPERFIDATQHPCWTRSGLSGEGAGLAIFRNAVSFFD
ncbi:Phosphoribosylformylglycinamidine synthase [Pseudobythopirellula maris]|uniref:Phosphoribosylformylglycinamidine synthase n=1 Tax=Pseudobythopirellula maris TaxID=2527991 RepID=A0A5C5ZTC4_9BACT|nr:phosphoribosylformylglycinamidine synthase subunit PurQ [Pseudobythopirellula maris]TWT90729.1 Phosphoribosylformylglycinamidine synthase [Pseudobythopirellula maris]